MGHTDYTDLTDVVVKKLRGTRFALCGGVKPCARQTGTSASPLARSDPLSILNPQSSIPNPQFPILNPQFSILNSQFPIPNSQLPPHILISHCKNYAFSLIFSNRITIFSNWQFCGFAISRIFQMSITIFSNHLNTYQ